MTNLYEAARVIGGRIVQTHINACPALGGGRCNCATAEFKVIRTSAKAKVAA